MGPPNGGPPKQQQQGPPTTSSSGNGPRLPPGAVKVLPSNQQQQQHGGPNKSGGEVAAKVRSYAQASIVNLIEAANGKTISDDLLDRISDNARFSLKLADDFVQLARLSSTAPKLEPVDLVALADEASDRAYSAAVAFSVTIELECDSEVPLVWADPWLLIRVLGNLLDNAIKFSPPGETVSCIIALADEGTKVTCGIVDRGPGIDVERQESLFERFGSVDRTRGRSAGLGLAFVKKAMDAMGATIDCRTGPDGTSFDLCFDAAEEPDLA